MLVGSFRPRGKDVNLSLFNLLEEPWIECIDSRGCYQEASLQALLLGSQHYRQLASPLALVNASVFVLLQTILLRALPLAGVATQDPQAWAQVYRAGRWPDETLTAYLQRWHQRFYLIDAQQPFWQEDIPAQGTTSFETSAMKLLPHFSGGSGGNTSTLFDHHTLAEGIQLSLPQAALDMRMGVRVDQEGLVLPDFHMAHDVINYAGRGGNSVISTRMYLSDAIFVVGLESAELALLQGLQQALHQPRWLLCLGRRSFPPSQPVWLPDGLRIDQELLPALRAYPCLLSEHTYPLAGQLRFVIEEALGTSVQHDQPLSYMPHQHRPRAFSTYYFAKPDTILQVG